MNINYKNNIQIKKLKDLTTKAPKSKYSANSIVLMEQGNTKCFTSGSKFYFVNKELVNGEYIFINDGGIADIKYHNGSACYTDHVFALKINSNLCNGIYLYNYLLTKLETINNKMFVGCGLKNIVKEDFLNLDIPLPEKSIQDFIASIFLNIDKNLEKEENNITKLKETKLSFLGLLFPQNVDIPQLRFRSFTDTWEQCKLGEVVGVYDGVHQTPDYKTQGIMFLSVENIVTLKSENFISEDAFKRDYKVYPEYGDVLMTRIGDVGTPHVVETNEKMAFYVSLALLKPKTIDSYFLSNSILSNRFQKSLRDKTLLTAVPQKINKDEIGKVDIIIPSKKEQVLIGNYFNRLDHLITLHQCKSFHLVFLITSILSNILSKYS